MRNGDASSSETEQASQDARVPGPRPAGKTIQILLPVWGYEFVHQFLEWSLPTLLAPGNLPALSSTLPTEFVFLTSAADAAMLREHPACRSLAKLCPVRFEAIDDLITDGNYSTTITLAYERAIRRAGPTMLDTYFFFLVSDFIFADGSLASVIARMQAGASAVQVGNFQVVEEEAREWLHRRIGSPRESGASAPLMLQPCELMRWALTCIHPTTMANTVNLGLFHNTHTNRLFWRVDDDTLIGRFYLMHMICIRPEASDFIIGASCDYSFVPEMCPSGNIAVMTDSDDYLAIEVQPRRHESRFLRLGPIDPIELARSLSEWTTAAHRQNARHTLCFHAGERPPELPRFIAEADAFVGRISGLLAPRPQPHRNHPYWRGAMAAFQSAVGQRPDRDDWRLMLMQAQAQVPGYVRTLDQIARRARTLLFGEAPRPRRLHPRWADFRIPRAALERLTAVPARRVLSVSEAPTPFTDWLSERAPHAVRIPTKRLLHRRIPNELRPASFDALFLDIMEWEFDRAAKIIDSVLPLLKPGAEILVVSFNPRWLSDAAVFKDVFRAHAPCFLRAGIAMDEVWLNSVSRLRWWIAASFARNAKAMLHRPGLDLPFRALGACLLLLPMFCANLIGGQRSSPWAKARIVSSVFMRFHVTDLLPAGTESEGAVPADPSGHRDADTHALTREPQYQRLLEIRDEVGLTPLGLMTNQVWHEDPRRLAFILARYKFVAKMLSGWEDVAELGCGDAFGTRIVLQEASKVTVYDFDRIFIDDVRRRQSKQWPLEAIVHDILDDPLPRRHNAIFSLDVIEHIPAEQEDLFLRNLCASLTEHGILIIGTPSLESQAYASPQSKIGHVNCKSGRALKSLLKRYFHTVLLFSMNDEVVHTGFYPMAHYLFAVCSDLRR